MHKHRFFLCAIFFVLWMTLIFPTMTVSADCGPKSCMTLHVKNPPDGAYAISLLRYNDEWQEQTNYFSDQHSYHYDDPMKEIINSYAVDGWSVYDYQDNKNWQESNEDHTYEFWEFPITYRVIIVTKIGAAYVSETKITESFSVSMNVDFEKMKSSEKSVEDDSDSVSVDLTEYFSMFFSMLQQQLWGTYLITLFFEGILWLCFRIPRKPRRNLAALFWVNFLTQVILYACLVWFALVGSLLLLLSEVGIVLLEIILYLHVLTGVSRKRIVGYTITANVVSFLIGTPLYLILCLFFI